MSDEILQGNLYWNLVGGETFLESEDFVKFGGRGEGFAGNTHTLKK